MSNLTWQNVISVGLQGHHDGGAWGRGGGEGGGSGSKVEMSNITWQNVVSVGLKLQALVSDILPSTTAVFSYAIGS